MAKMRRCPWCLMMAEEGPPSCPYCHKKFVVLPDGSLTSEGMEPCPHCGNYNKPDSWRCDKCKKVIDGSDASLAKTPGGEKILNIIGKIYVSVFLLVIPVFFAGMGWFLAVFFVGIAASLFAGTVKGSKTLKEASDSTFMFCLLFILFGGYLTVMLGRIVADARAAKVDHYSQDQLLIFSGCVLLTGIAGALWASRQGIPNIWKYIKDLLAD